jgi:hypothetical protein
MYQVVFPECPGIIISRTGSQVDVISAKSAALGSEVTCEAEEYKAAMANWPAESHRPLAIRKYSLYHNKFNVATSLCLDHNRS